MPKVLKARRVSNPSKKRRKKMSAKQIGFFGTKAQRAALKKRRTNPKRRKNFPGGSRIQSWSKGRKTYKVKRHRNRARRRKNVGQILTASLSGLNPGVKRMAKRKRTRKVHNRRRRVSRKMHNRRRRNPSTRVIYRYRGRKHARRNRGRRRNPSMLSGKAGRIVGTLGGAALTSILSTSFIPSQFQTGIMGYVASGIVAMVQGKLVGKFTKSPALGDDMVIGGLVYVALRVITDMIPSVAGYLPFKLSGLGLIAPSSFYTPQVNMPGSMSTFVTPAAIPAPVTVAAGMHGLGRNARRVGRMGY